MLNILFYKLWNNSWQKAIFSSDFPGLSLLNSFTIYGNANWRNYGPPYLADTTLIVAGTEAIEANK